MGTLAGSAESAEGAASYTIPIKVAPGSNGMVPSVSVSYNSMGGSGIAGYGWNISAASAITRVGQNIYFDGKTRPLKLDNQDRLVLDGQRLIKKSGSTYMGNGTKYGKEMEDYSTVTAHGQIGSAPEWFEVVAKDGTKYEYGRTSNARMTNSSNNQVFAWYLNKVIRTDGNYMKYVYRYNGWGSGFREQMLIHRIEYTGNENVNRAPYNTVNFYYGDNRIDKNEVYQVGTKITSKKLLDKIQVKAENQFVREYKFKYAEDDVNSFLKEVIEYGSDYAHFNSTIFKYGDKPVEFEEQVEHLSYGNNSIVVPADYNGDGISEVLEAYDSGNYDVFGVHKRNSAGAFTVSSAFAFANSGYSLVNGERIYHYNSFRSSDFDGDNKDDIVVLKFASSNNNETIFPKFVLFKSTSTSTGPITFEQSGTEIISSHPVINGVNFDRFDNKYTVLADFDGDGATDILYVAAAYSTVNIPSVGILQFYHVKIFITNPKKGIVHKEILDLGSIIGTAIDEFPDLGEFTPIDFDGDGKQELMISKANNTKIYSYKLIGNNITQSKLYDASYPTSGHRIYFGDFNADGKTDLLTRDKTNNNAQWHIAYSKGNDFVVLPFNFENTPDITGLDDDDKLIIGDFNGDGKSDIYHGRNTQHWEWIYDSNGNIVWGHYVSNPENTIYYSKGMNIFKSKKDTGGSLLGQMPAIPFDLNGDGRMNVVNRENWNTSQKLELSFNRNGKDLLLEKVKNGLNHETKWEYKRMNEQVNPIYSRTVSGQYPNTTLSSSLNLVKSVTIPDGIGGDNEQTFTYEDAFVNSEGKGYLGFAKTASKITKTNARVETEKSLNISPPSLVPDNTLTFANNNVNSWMTKSQSTGAFIQIGNSKRYKYQMISTQLDDNINRKQITTDLSYDGFGNVMNKTEKIFRTTYYTTDYYDPATVGAHTLKQTTVTTSTYGTFNTPVPAKPTQIITTNTRTNETPFTTKTTFSYYTYGAPYQKGMLRNKNNFDGNNLKRNYTYYGYNNKGLYLVRTRALKVNSTNQYEIKNNYIYKDAKARFIIKKRNPISQYYDFKTFDNKTGNVILETGLSGLSNGYEYDGFGRLKKTKIYAPGSTTTVDFETTKSYHWADPNNNPKSVFYIENHHPKKPDSKVWYDIVGRKTKTVTKGFQNADIINRTNYNYYANNLTEVEQIGPYKSGETGLSVKTRYDSYGRVSKIIKSGGFGTTNYAYYHTFDGIKTTVTTPDGNQTIKVVDPTGKVFETTDNGGTLKYYYFSHGNIRKVKMGLKTLVSNEYDAAGRQTKMIDKNAGTTQYVYDNFGQLVSQTTANGKTSTMKYDKLGRMTEKVYFEGKTTYSYYPSNNGAKTNQIKKITKFLGTGSTIASSEEFNYSTRGLLNWKKVRIPSDNLSLISTYTFNNYGDMTSMTYPSGFGLSYELDANGYLKKIKKKGTSYTLFENKGMNGYNQLTEYKMGNHFYSPTVNIDYHFGIPTRYRDERFGNPAYGNQDLRMEWDYLSGNLENRFDFKKNRREEFDYDSVNRLISAKGVSGPSGNGIQTINTNFANNGNITSKTDAGNYFYQSPKINAVTGIYAGGGSAIPTMTQDITYTSFLQPKHISEGAFTLDYTYGADEQRIKSITKQNNNQINKRYYFSGWERDITSGVTRDLHYISAGGRLIAIVERKNGTDYYHYTYTDHLGSIVATCNQSGTKETEQNFDAWGRKRNPTTWSYSNVPNAPVWLYRGYTGHEGLKNFRLINMNGRIYDPVVGRMLSVDNYIQAGGYTQSYNRYSYAFNNPLKYDDPDGEFVAAALLGAGIGVISNGIGNLLNDKGFFQGAGKAALLGAIGGALTFGIGSVATQMAANGASKLGVAAFQALNHGMIGGGLSLAQGGSIQSGFLSGALSSGMSSFAAATDVGQIGMIGVGALTGGVGSKIGGGSFSSGFFQGLMTSGLNHAAHNGLFGEGYAMSLLTGRARHIIKPDAQSWGLNVSAGLVVTGEVEIGGLRVYEGPEKGSYTKTIDGGIGAGVEGGSLTGQITNLYHSGPRESILAADFLGSRVSIGVGIGAGVGGSLHFSVSKVYRNNDVWKYNVYGSGFGIGIGASPGLFSGSINLGRTKERR